ncbi:MAG: zeta toxin family protein, partial [Planctomycetota bacterium]
IAGSNGAGKSTFFETFLSDCGLRFINADVIAEGLEISPYEAAELAASIRTSLVSQRESFIFETVLSDPIGDKVDTLAKYSEAGYTVVLIFIQVRDVGESIRRVAMRASQGGHDVPDEKLKSRFERTKANLGRAIARLPHVLVYDNSDLESPYRLVSIYEHGKPVSDY